MRLVSRDANDMAAFCNQFDKICNETGCSVIYCHHHSKGAQGMKRAIDRASGSVVFARDPDAQLDIIELEMTEEVQCHAAETKGTAWRLETSLREFPNITPTEFWFEYPIHRADNGKYLKTMPATGSFEAGKMKNKRSKTAEEANEEFRRAFEIISFGRAEIPISEIAEYLGLAEKTMYTRAKRLGKEFKVKKGMVRMVEMQENQGSDGSSGEP
jgi:RecA-family ATPase